VTAGLLVARWAAAAGPCVVVEGAPGDATVAQLAVELRASGFTVTTMVAEPNGPPAARPRAGIDAIVRVGLGAIEVWWVERASGEAAPLDIIRVADTDPTVAALRAEEVVRARLLPPDALGPAESALPPAEAPSAMPTPAAAPTPASEPSSVAPSAAPGPALFGLDAGVLVLLSAGGVSPAADVLLMPRWTPAPQLELRAILAVPLTSPALTSIEGQATVGEWLVGGAVDWSLLAGESPWALTVGAGAGAARIQTTGTAQAPYVSSSGDVWAFSPFITAGAGRRLGSSQVRVGLSGWVGTSLPAIGIRFGGRDVATWGEPWTGIALTLQLDVL
jgi:hypothetical protein